MWPALFSPIWEALHLCTRALPRDDLTPQQIQEVYDYLRSQIPLLPCPGCAMDAKLYFIQNIPKITTGQDAFAYTVQMHNYVNRKTQKREYSVEEAESELQQRTTKTYQRLLRDGQRQLDDHKKIKALEAELKIFRNIPHVTTNESLLKYIIIAMVVSFAVLFFLLLMFGILVKQNQNLKSAFAMSQAH